MGFLRFSARNEGCICYGLPEWFGLMFTEVVTSVTGGKFWGRFEAVFITTDPPSSEALWRTGAQGFRDELEWESDFSQISRIWSDLLRWDRGFYFELL